jgi:hypothetical protein
VTPAGTGAPTRSAWACSTAATSVSWSTSRRPTRRCSPDVALGVERAQPSAGVPATTSARPMIARPSGCSAEDRLAEDVEDLVLRVVLVHRDLLEDDLALVDQVVVGEARAPHHVGDHVERLGSGGRARGRRPSRLLARARVELAPIVSKIWSISSEP